MKIKNILLPLLSCNILTFGAGSFTTSCNDNGEPAPKPLSINLWGDTSLYGEVGQKGENPNPYIIKDENLQILENVPIIFECSQPGISFANNCIKWNDQLSIGTYEITLTAKLDDLTTTKRITLQIKNHFYFDTWSNVITYANQGLDSLKEHYNLDTFVGETRPLDINGKNVVVRVIDEGVDQYTLGGSRKTAALTFEFVELPTSGDYLLAGDFNHGGNNKISTSHMIQLLLNSEAESDQIYWYKPKVEKDVIMRRKSLFLMMPDELRASTGLKPIWKKAAERSVGALENPFNMVDYQAKLSLLTFADIFSDKAIDACTNEGICAEEGIYKGYYKQERASGRTGQYAYYRQQVQDKTLDLLDPPECIFKNGSYCWLGSADFRYYTIPYSGIRYEWSVDKSSHKIVESLEQCGPVSGLPLKCVAPVFAI